VKCNMSSIILGNRTAQYTPLRLIKSHIWPGSSKIPSYEETSI
jgi:hypothetical protein